MIRGLNKSTGKIYRYLPEIRPLVVPPRGQGHLQGGADRAEEYGYTGKNDKVYLQCFDDELKRIDGELMPASAWISSWCS